MIDIIIIIIVVFIIATFIIIVIILCCSLYVSDYELESNSLRHRSIIYGKLWY
jgi:hypothetical protein